MRLCLHPCESQKWTLYIGVTSNLSKRVAGHKQGLIVGFTKRYGVHRLVHYEVYTNMREAILREKRLKKWNRAWKIELVKKLNPEWRDLYEKVCSRPGILPRF